MNRGERIPENNGKEWVEEMDEKLRIQLEEVGIDVEDALKRFLGNTEAFIGFLKKFPSDPNYMKLEKAVEEDDQDKALSASHILKGVCGNLSIMPLYTLLAKQIERIRAKDWPAAAGFMPEIRREYEIITGVLRKLP